MATRLYSVNRGGDRPMDVTETVGSGTTANVEVTIDFDAPMSKQQAVLALEAVIERILQGNWPPA